MGRQAGLWPKSLAHPHGIATDPATGVRSAQFNQVQDLIDPVTVNAAGPGHDSQVVASAPCGMDCGRIQHRPYRGGGVVQIGIFDPGHSGIPAGRPNQPA